jgi:hypothetical protein
MVDRSGAERAFPRGLGQVETDPGLEPDPVFVHQRDQADGSSTELRGETCQIVDPVGLTTEFEYFGDHVGRIIAPSGRFTELIHSGKDLTFTPLHLASSVVKPGGDTAVTTTTVDTPKTLRFHFLDVGQGNGTLIECPHGELILFDFGTAKNSSKTKGPVMDFINSKGAKLDYLLVSHADKDHVNLLPLLEGFTFGKVICGGEALKDFWIYVAGPVRVENGASITAVPAPIDPPSATSLAKC